VPLSPKEDNICSFSVPLREGTAIEMLSLGRENKHNYKSRIMFKITIEV
jgi:hypothetical protein